MSPEKTPVGQSKINEVQEELRITKIEAALSLASQASKDPKKATETYRELVKPTNPAPQPSA